ncbi:MAG TPA: diacylglycerol kinase family protein [Candidatus Binatus sp.]|jgi:diacylglycerol kinase (ATP)|nr:diacylglycerol kinase family protein [Candidatus Binatus sp.]
MRAAAILGLGCSPKQLGPFQGDKKIEWRMGMPASNDDADVVLVFGGDGTIHRHLGQLVRLGLPVLVVPAGSGNDFARALGLRRVRDSIAAWVRFCGSRENVRRVDLGVIAPVESAGGAPFDKLRAGSSTIAQGRSAPHSPRYFCCVAGVGLDGEVSRRANRLPRWLRGHGGYVLSLAPTIFTFAALPMKILTQAEGGEDWTMRSDRPTMLAAFANTPTYGGGMKIAPQAKMDDGLLDVCIVGGVDPFKLFCMFPTIFSGRHLNIEEVEYFQAGRVRVETEHPLDVYADGEFVRQTPVEVGVERAALKVVTP